MDTANGDEPEAGDAPTPEFLAQIRQQRYTGQSRIVAALRGTGGLDPDLDPDEANDVVYALLSPEVHLILTVERCWPADRYERWIARSLATLLRKRVELGGLEPPTPCLQSKCSSS